MASHDVAGTEGKVEAKTIKEEAIRNRKLLTWCKESKRKQKPMIQDQPSCILQGFPKVFASDFIYILCTDPPKICMLGKEIRFSHTQ